MVATVPSVVEDVGLLHEENQQWTEVKCKPGRPLKGQQIKFRNSKRVLVSLTPIV